MKKPVLLLAEDNDLDAILLDRLIQRSDVPFQLVRVEHGEAAIHYLQGLGTYGDRALSPLPDVLLLDLKMPRKDGFAVLQWRRENPAFNRLPIVVFSSSQLQEDITRAYALGANSYVVKPSDPAKLACLVEALHAWWGVFNVTAGPA